MVSTRSIFVVWRAIAASIIFVHQASLAQNLCTTGTCVTTWQDDNYRTGQNLSENVVTYQTIKTDNFGQLCAVQLDGQVYAQPLIVTNVVIPNQGTFDVAYVVTQNDMVYGIDATPPVAGAPCHILLGPQSLLTNNFVGQPVMTAVDCANLGGGKACPTVKPTVGVLGSPVIAIDQIHNTGTLYVVEETQSGNSQQGFTYYHFLHALNITTLAEGVGNENYGAPLQICGSGCGKSKSSSSSFSQAHIQRPALLLANCGSCGNQTYVYVTFSMMDGTGTPYPNGAIFGYNATSLATGQVYYETTFGTTGHSTGAGIWMGGAGPAYGDDSSSGTGYIYVTTGNGTFDLDLGGHAAGDSFLKLNANLTLADYFTPFDQFYRNDPSCGPNGGNDLDFGSGGVMLVPDGEFSLAPYIAISGDKEGGIWVMDRAKPGRYPKSCDSTCMCLGATNRNLETVLVPPVNMAEPFIHNNPAFWDNDPNQNNGFVYIGPYNSQIYQYPLQKSAAPLGGGPAVGTMDATGTKPITFGWGVTPTISADSTSATDAIVWALTPGFYTPQNDPESSVPGILYAFDADNLTLLYTSHLNGCAKDEINPATKFSIPTVANGYVYLGTESDNQNIIGKGTFYIFGLRRQC